MGTLGGDFLSSLPLHEYPPAFPLGADIQGMTRITAWGPGLPRPPRNQFRTLAPLQSFLAILQRATIQGTSLSLCAKAGDMGVISSPGGFPSCAAAKSKCYNYRAVHCSYRSPYTLEPVRCNKTSHCNKKPACCN